MLPRIFIILTMLLVLSMSMVTMCSAVVPVVSGGAVVAASSAAAASNAAAASAAAANNAVASTASAMDLPQMNFSTLEGKRVQLHAGSYSHYSGWYVTVIDSFGSWILVSGDDGSRHLVNTNHLTGIAI